MTSKKRSPYEVVQVVRTNDIAIVTCLVRKFSISNCSDVKGRYSRHCKSRTTKVYMPLDFTETSLKRELVSLGMLNLDDFMQETGEIDNQYM